MQFAALHTQNLIAIVAIGLVAGWLASLLVGGGGGLIWDLVIGLIGSFVGAFILHAFGVTLPIANPLFADIIMSTLGAVIVVVIARVIA